MSEYVKLAQSYAQQSLVVTPAGKELVRRTATCPTHVRQTSDFLGVTEEGWTFKCREKGGHLFVAKPDKSVPKTAEDIQAWMQKQRAARLERMNQHGA